MKKHRVKKNYEKPKLYGNIHKLYDKFPMSEVGGGEPGEMPSGVFRADLVFSLAAPGVEHYVNPQTGRQWLGVDPSVPYPDPSSDESVQRVLLDRASVIGYEKTAFREGQTIFKLPDNYASMAQSLNDALSLAPQAHALNVARSFFAELGNALHDLTTKPRLLPKQLHYSQVIFLRDKGGIKLLPPLEFIPATPEAVKKVTRELVDSCTEAATTPQQVVNVHSALQGLIDTFGKDWE